MSKSIIALLLMTSACYGQTIYLDGNGRNDSYGVEIKITSTNIDSVIGELERLAKRIKDCNLCRNELGNGSISAASGGFRLTSSVKITRPSAPALSDDELEKLRELLKGKR